MSSQTKKIIFISILCTAVIGICIGFFLYNKGPLNVEDQSSTPVTAVDLYTLYSSDTLMARNKFSDQVLEVTGEVKEVSLNTQKQPVILLKTATELAHINCTLEKKDRETLPGQKITIKGICRGIGEGDADLGIMGDVYLIRCLIIK